MRCFVMFVTAVCVLFLLKLKWPKNKSFYTEDVVYSYLLLVLTPHRVVFVQLKIAKYKACDSNQEQISNYRRTSPGLISRCQHREGESGLAKHKLSAYTQTTHKLRRADGRENK